MSLREESSMSFILDDDCTIFIEDNIKESKIEKVKTVEFIYKKENKVSFVEAKTSFSKVTNKDDFNKNIEDIIEKYISSLSLFHSALLGRFSNLENLSPYKKVHCKDYEYILFLIIKNHKKEWLPPVHDKLKQSLKPLLEIWNIKDANVKVLNEDVAREQGLIK